MTVRLFGGAAEEFGAAKTEINGVADLKGLVDALSLDRPERLREVLDQCSFFVDGEHRRGLEATLRDGCEVDVLPPFAGG